MDAAERFRRGDTFEFLEWFFGDKFSVEPKNESVTRYIDDATKVFEGVIKSLDSVLNYQEGRNFYFEADMREIVRVTGIDLRSHSRADAQEAIEQFKGYIAQLKSLKENPKGVRNREKYADLADACRRIKDFYSENYRVLGQRESEDIDASCVMAS
jgi:hypothetical protein